MDADTLTTQQAAERLGVSVRQVQRLTESGTIRKVGIVGRTLLLDTTSVLSLAQQGSGRGRRWHETTAWAALELLSGRDDVTVADASRRWHLHHRISHMSAEELIRATRSRAHLHRYRASASYVQQLAKEVARTGVSALSDRTHAQQLGLAVVRTDALDGYVTRDQLDGLVNRFHLVDDERGNVTVRAVQQGSHELLPRGGVVDAAVLALDLAESLDPRQRDAGKRHLHQLVAAL